MTPRKLPVDLRRAAQRGGSAARRFAEHPAAPCGALRRMVESGENMALLLRNRRRPAVLETRPETSAAGCDARARLQTAALPRHGAPAAEAGREREGSADTRGESHGGCRAESDGGRAVSWTQRPAPRISPPPAGYPRPCGGFPRILFPDRSRRRCRRRLIDELVAVADRACGWRC